MPPTIIQSRKYKISYTSARCEWHFSWGRRTDMARLLVTARFATVPRIVLNTVVEVD